jgi:hypothetical protein
MTPAFLKPYLTKKNYRLLGFAVAGGLLLGALLGYTIFLNYKSTALLRFHMGGADFKPLVEMTKDPVALNKFINDQNLKDDTERYTAMLKATVRGTGKWIEPILRISKQDAKEMGVDPTKMPTTDEVIGLQITAKHRDPDTALAMVKLQTNFALQVQMKEGIESWVRGTELSALGRLERYEASKLKTAYEVSEIQTRLKEYKRVMQQYPETSLLDSKPFISLEKGSERFLPIPNQLSVMELRLVDIKEQVVREEREKKKDEVALNLVKQIGESKLRATNSKAWLDESINTVKAKLNTLTDERERLAAIDVLNGFHGLRTRYVDNITYILEPRAAERPEQPRPIMLAALFAFLGGLGALLWVFKDLIAQLFKQDEEGAAHA